MSESGDTSRYGLMRCTQTGCKGTLGPTGQEVFRLCCALCGQNYFVRLVLEPVKPADRPLALPVGRAE